MMRASKNGTDEAIASTSQELGRPAECVFNVRSATCSRNRHAAVACTAHAISQGSARAARTFWRRVALRIMTKSGEQMQWASRRSLSGPVTRCSTLDLYYLFFRLSFSPNAHTHTHHVPLCSCAGRGRPCCGPCAVYAVFQVRHAQHRRHGRPRELHGHLVSARAGRTAAYAWRCLHRGGGGVLGRVREERERVGEEGERAGVTAGPSGILQSRRQNPPLRVPCFSFFVSPSRSCGNALPAARGSASTAFWTAAGCVDHAAGLSRCPLSVAEICIARFGRQLGLTRSRRPPRAFRYEIADNANFRKVSGAIVKKGIGGRSGRAEHGDATGPSCAPVIQAHRSPLSPTAQLTRRCPGPRGGPDLHARQLHAEQRWHRQGEQHRLQGYVGGAAASRDHGRAPHRLVFCCCWTPSATVAPHFLSRHMHSRI